jgi:hypothetical protein
MKAISQLVLAMLCAWAFITANVVQAESTGRDVTRVIYANGGQPLGMFIQTGQDQWLEHSNQNNNTFYYTERGRDDWSVYLHDQARSVNIQLDLHRKKVGYSQGGGQMSDIYDIARSESIDFNSGSSSNVAPVPQPAPHITNGYNVIGVSYNGGFFRLNTGTTWTENNIFTFVERGRDEWSVYLYDGSRDVHIQLDLHRKKVSYSQGGGARSDLYDIVSFY